MNLKFQVSKNKMKFIRRIKKKESKKNKIQQIFDKNEGTKKNLEAISPIQNRHIPAESDLR